MSTCDEEKLSPIIAGLFLAYLAASVGDQSTLQPGDYGKLLPIGMRNRYLIIHLTASDEL